MTTPPYLEEELIRELEVEVAFLEGKPLPLSQFIENDLQLLKGQLNVGRTTDPSQPNDDGSRQPEAGIEPAASQPLS